MSARRSTEMLLSTIKDFTPLEPVSTLKWVRRYLEEGSTSCISSSLQIHTIRSRNTTTGSPPFDEAARNSLATRIYLFYSQIWTINTKGYVPTTTLLGI